MLKIYFIFDWFKKCFIGLKGKNFIYEVFSIMMVEVIVIMNFRLIIMILSDLDMFFVLSFVILLN